MAKVVPKNEYCGLANTYEVKKVDSSELSKLKLLDKKNIPMKKIVEKVIELEEAALDNKKIINSEGAEISVSKDKYIFCLLYTSPSPRDRTRSRMPSSA